MTESNTSLYKYKVIICWSDEDEAFVAEVPELAGCVTDGATYLEVAANIETAIGEWVETAKELRRTIPEAKMHSDLLDPDGTEWTRLAESSLEFWSDEEEDIYVLEQV